MVAAVETRDGQAAFASLRQPAWHGLGTVFSEVMTRTEIMDTAHLSDWNVRLVALSDVTDFDSYVKENFLVIRDNPFDSSEQDVLAVVGSRYNPIQNESVFSFGDNLLDGGGVWETAGSIKGGTVVFGSMSFSDESFILDPEGRADKVNTYLLVTSSHDGSAPVTVLATPTRVVCQNTLNVALRGAKNTYKIRHTLNADHNVAEAQKALGVSFAYFGAFEAEASAMIQAEIKKSQAMDFFEIVYPKPEADVKGALTKWQNKMDTLESIYLGTGEQGDASANITGTLWGAVNAATERLDWYRSPRSGNTEAVLVSASGLDDNATRERQKIWDAAKALLPA